MEINRNEQYMTAEQVCDWLKINKNYLYRMVGGYEFPVITLGHQTRRYNKDEIEKWLDIRQKGSAD